jgi:catalase-peroxidase
MALLLLKYKGKETKMTEEAKCPVPHEVRAKMVGQTTSAAKGTSTKKWFPEAISLDPLIKNSPKSNPMGEDFDYAKEFSSLNLDDVKQYIKTIMIKNGPDYEASLQASGLPGMPYGQDFWWPADWGHYGPLFVRLAWHSAGTYRVSDGRGGAGQGLIRFSPLNSWPDNGNLDKARRILWPVKERYGRKLSWADLFIIAGNVALESMGLELIGFSGGREDVWEPDDTYWGPEAEFLESARYDSSRDADSLEDPLAAVQMGLIYVNPEGPDGNYEDFVGAARDIRTTFSRMAMNDEETVALLAGGHAFGKSHGGGDPSKLGPAPEATPLENVGLGWINPQGKGHSEDTITHGIEGAWTPNPLRWDNDYLRLMFQYEWESVVSPAGARQWSPINCAEEDMVPDAHIPGKMNKPMMQTTDLALRFGDDKYRSIAEKFLNDFDHFSRVFARAWFKLTHRDLGSTHNYVGSDLPSETFLWQDPVHDNTNGPLSEANQDVLREKIATALAEAKYELTVPRGPEMQTRPLDVRDLMFTAWVSASTYRVTDKRGGSNGARILLEPMKSWEFTNYYKVEKTISFLSEIRDSLNFKISMADLIVFAGNFGVETGIKNAKMEYKLPFTGGRGDATQDQIDEESFNYLEPIHDGFLNWTHPVANGGGMHKLDLVAEHLFIERAALLGLTPPEMVALFAGFRSMSLHHGQSEISSVSWNRNNGHKLNRDFLENCILKPWYKWTGWNVSDTIASNGEPAWRYTGKHYVHDTVLQASRADLLIASNSILRGIGEVYASIDGDEILAKNFVSAWTKIMNYGVPGAK